MADEETQKASEGEAKKEATPQNKGFAEQEKAIYDDVGLIKRATEAAERIEEANKEMSKLLKKQEVMWATQRLQGRSTSEQEKQESEQDIKKRQAKEFFKGSEIEKAIERYG